jgi:putative addiction module CopG family antidote
MPKVRLTPQMQKYAEREIATGGFVSMSEVVLAGMRLLMEQRGALAFQRLRLEIDPAVDELEAGGGKLFDPSRYR